MKERKDNRGYMEKGRRRTRKSEGKREKRGKEGRQEWREGRGEQDQWRGAKVTKRSERRSGRKRKVNK